MGYIIAGSIGTLFSINKNKPYLTITAYRKVEFPQMYGIGDLPSAGKDGY